MLQGAKHIAIIMDGNGRWAKAKGFPRAEGHRRGAIALRRTIKAAQACDIKNLTVFGFSSENWRRPESEISDLMKLLRHYLTNDIKELHKSNIKLNVIGDISAFSSEISDLINKATDKTSDNDGLVLTIALNYGGRADIVAAAKKLSDSGADFTEDNLSHELMTKSLPDLDLLIRTGGEKRVSNFLLWQLSYAELYFTDVLWPDFEKSDLQAALDDFKSRDRRFGGLAEE